MQMVNEDSIYFLMLNFEFNVIGFFIWGGEVIIIEELQILTYKKIIF